MKSDIFTDLQVNHVLWIQRRLSEGGIDSSHTWTFVVAQGYTFFFFILKGYLHEDKSAFKIWFVELGEQGYF